MHPQLNQLIEYIKSTKVFRRNKKNVELKILAALLYFFGLSLRKTSDFLSLFEEISHESVRIYYHRLKTVLKQPEKKKRKLSYRRNKDKAGKETNLCLGCDRR